MSSDTVDLLHDAEDFFLEARETVRGLLGELHANHARVELELCPKPECQKALEKLRGFDGYCRCEDGEDPDTCGCPCGRHDAGAEERDMELYCPAEVTVDGGKETVGCLIKGPPHPGVHGGRTQAPCPSCAGLERHADWCPEIGATGFGWIDLHFDDEGWYWTTPPDGVGSEARPAATV